MKKIIMVKPWPGKVVTRDEAEVLCAGLLGRLPTWEEQVLAGGGSERVHVRDVALVERAGFHCLKVIEDGISVPRGWLVLD
jgi:hypothetical protein